jgi:hypothetical protein
MQASVHIHCLKLTPLTSLKSKRACRTQCRATVVAPGSQVNTHRNYMQHWSAKRNQHAGLTVAHSECHSNHLDVQCDVLATFDHLPLLNKRILITGGRFRSTCWQQLSLHAMLLSQQFEPTAFARCLWQCRIHSLPASGRIVCWLFVQHLTQWLSKSQQVIFIY